MKKSIIWMALTMCIFGFNGCNTGTEPPPPPPPGSNPIDALIPDVPNSTILIPAYFDGLGVEQRAARHATQKIEVAQKGPNLKLYMIGDSITEGFSQAGISSWNMMAEKFGANRIINMGVGADGIQNMLWRLDDGAFPSNCKPEYAVIMAGTNNLGNIFDSGYTEEEIAAGIGTICKIINTRSPSTKILLFSIFPRRHEWDPADQREKIAAVNAILKTYGDGVPYITYIDVTSLYQNPDNSLKTDLFDSDMLHLVAPGYAVWADEIVKAIEGGTLITQLNLSSLVPQPVSTQTPVYSAASDQYTMTIAWQTGSTSVTGDAEFMPLLEYTATAAITLRAGLGNTLTGLAADSFTHSGASSVVYNPATNIVTLTFPATQAATITHKDLTNYIPSPIAGQTPPSQQNAIQYNLNPIAWSVTGGAAHTGPFVLGVSYTASATIVPGSGFNLDGLAADFFTHLYATVSLAGNTVTLNFPAVMKLTDLNLSTKFPAPLNRRVPVRSFTSEQYDGTIAWYRTGNDLITENEIFGSDNGSTITAVISLTPKGEYDFADFSGNFVYIGANSVSVQVASVTAATVTVVFPPIPEPAHISRWRRGASGNDANPDPNVSDMFWIHFYNDGTFLIYNSHSGKGGRTEAAEGVYTLAGVNGLTPGDVYSMDINWVDAYAAIGSDQNNPPQTIFVGENVGGPKPALPGEDDPIAGNKYIGGTVNMHATDGLILQVSPRWHDNGGLAGHVSYVNHPVQ